MNYCKPTTVTSLNTIFKKLIKLKRRLCRKILKFLIKYFVVFYFNKFKKKYRYEIQSGMQDPYEDCVATMRLYERMSTSQSCHQVEDYPLATDPQNRNNFATWRQNELERMSPQELLNISRSDYYCWCLDATPHRA